MAHTGHQRLHSGHLYKPSHEGATSPLKPTAPQTHTHQALTSSSPRPAGPASLYGVLTEGPPGRPEPPPQVKSGPVPQGSSRRDPSQDQLQSLPQPAEGETGDLGPWPEGPAVLQAEGPLLRPLGCMGNPPGPYAASPQPAGSQPWVPEALCQLFGLETQGQPQTAKGSRRCAGSRADRGCTRWALAGEAGGAALRLASQGSLPVLTNSPHSFLSFQT